MKQYPLIKLNLLFISGIILQNYLHIQPLILIAVILIFIVITLIFHFIEINLLQILIIALSISAGSVSYQFALSGLKHYPFKETKIKSAEVYGRILQIEPVGSYELRFRFQADSIRINKKMFSIDHNFLCRIRDSLKELNLLSNQIAPGNYINMEGIISKASDQRNPGEFDYYNYLFRENISALFTTYKAKNIQIIKSEKNNLKSIVFGIQKSISINLEKLLNKEAESLMKGLILSDRRGIDPDITEDFINTGVIHVLSVSGLHIGYIVIIFIFLTGRLNYICRIPLIIIGIIIYTAITGAPPSVLRAAFMSIVVFIGLLTNRSSNLLNALSFACLLFLIYNPLDLYHPGFQLSYISVGAIGIFFNYFGEYFKKLAASNKLLANTAVFFCISLFAQAGTIPFIIYYFGRVSLVSLLVNIFVIPATGAVLGASIFMLLLNIIWAGGAMIYASAINFLVYLLYSIVHMFSVTDWSYIYIRHFSIVDGLLFYTFSFLLIYSLFKFKNIIFRLIVIPLVILNLIFCVSIDNKNILSENKLNVIAIDVGQGDSFLIKFPNGKTALIDAGEALEYFDNGKRVILPLLEYLDIPKIDYGFISHMDADHYEGYISLIRNEKIARIIKPAPEKQIGTDLKFDNWLKLKKIDVHYYKESIIKEGNTSIYIMNKPCGTASLTTNDRSAVIKIVYGNTSILFTGDTERQGEKYLINRYGTFLKSDILKLGHHGSRNSSTDKFLDVVNPSYALISAGRDNKFNHPSKEILHRLRERSIKTLRTDIQGAIIITTDGEKIDLVDWKNK